jgi:hypothetical protein
MLGASALAGAPCFSYIFFLLMLSLFGYIARRIFHELGLGSLISEAVGLAVDLSINRAVGLDLLAHGSAHCAHVVEFAGRRKSNCAQAKHDCASYCEFVHYDFSLGFGQTDEIRAEAKGDAETNSL